MKSKLLPSGLLRQLRETGALHSESVLAGAPVADGARQILYLWVNRTNGRETVVEPISPEQIEGPKTDINFGDKFRLLQLYRTDLLLRRPQ